MGYYDGPNTNENNQVENRVEAVKEKSKKGYFISGLVGAVIGAVTISFAVPYMPWANGTAQQKVQGTAVPVVNKTSGETDIPAMVEGAKEAVVGVMNFQQSADPFTMQVEEAEAGSGSGVIYKKVGDKALIVTNNHVVEGASKLQVELSDGTIVPAELVGTDPWLDLAVIQIDAEKVTKVATLGDSDKIRAGEPAIAIGNPLGFDGSVTEGVISSKEREIPVDINGDKQPDWQAQVIQTDAAINPGNSGGALFNENGEVIGINSSKIAQQEVEGIGFAIPINVAKPVLDSLEQFGEVQRPFMGVSYRSLDEIPAVGLERLKLPKDVTGGIMVAQVTPMSPAEKAGIQQYDIITELDGKPIDNAMDFREYLYEEKKVGDKMEVTLYRDGNKTKKTVTLTANSSN